MEVQDFLVVLPVGQHDRCLIKLLDVLGSKRSSESTKDGILMKDCGNVMSLNYRCYSFFKRKSKVIIIPYGNVTFK